MTRILHIATEADWKAGQRAGRYTTSTLGRTLAEEGFIHASRADQWQEVRRLHYAGVEEPLVLLVIDTELLEAPVIEETVGSGTESFPHVYGPLNLNAVVQAVPLADAEHGGAKTVGGESFGAVFLREMFVNAALGLVLIVLLAVGVLLGRAVDPGWGPWTGLLVGLVCGLTVIVVTNRRRRRL